MAYHRIISSTLRIPMDVSVPVPVGLLACQRDPFLKDLETHVITCDPSLGIEPSKDKKKAQPASQELGESIFELLLHDTILFPEGGGQPSDIGYIKCEDGSCWDVLEVKRRGGLAIRYITGNAEAILQSLIPGVHITVALGKVGFERRYDHMCMHTSQHLISALLETRLNLPTPSWYLTKYPNPAYVEVPRAPTAEELQMIEDAANEYCVQGTRLHVEVEELNDMPLSAGSRNASKGLPIDYAGGVNRTVVIENVDRNSCCGTHLPTLLGLTVFIVPQTEPLSRGRSRIFFCAGPRVRACLSRTHNLLTAAATTYGCAPDQVSERFAFETDGRRKAYKRVEELESEVAGFVVRDLQEERRRSSNSGPYRFATFRHRYDSSTNPLGLLTMIHSAWSASPASSAPYLIVLVSSGIRTFSNSAVILVFGSDEEVKELSDKLKRNGIKGGGRAGRWSGKTDNWKAVGGDAWLKGLLDC
ncbi:alanyl-tRNA synthetase domain-containing protein [Ramaria rubella]|nr:alanyl-tRNA synthetase domain-containing protein [Ramaria rubella]